MTVLRKTLTLLLALCLLALPLSVQAARLPGDGEYTVAVALSGGSGRAGVASPAALSIKDGVATATLVWSSPFYEFMLVDGVRYEPIQTQGNATFAIPVVFDAEIPVQAQTAAMSTPHMVAYTLRFDSGSIRPAQGRPLLFWGACAGVPLAALAAFFAVKKRRGAQAKEAGR